MQVLIVVQELVACDSEVQEALANTFEAVQKIQWSAKKLGFGILTYESAS